MSEPTNLNEHAVLEEALNVLVDSTARLAGLLDNDDKPRDFSFQSTPADYSPQNLRNSGVR